MLNFFVTLIGFIDFWRGVCLFVSQKVDQSQAWAFLYQNCDFSHAIYVAAKPKDCLSFKPWLKVDPLNII